MSLESVRKVVNDAEAIAVALRDINDALGPFEGRTRDRARLCMADWNDLVRFVKEEEHAMEIVALSRARSSANVPRESRGLPRTSPRDCSTVRFAACPHCGEDDMTCPMGNTYVYVNNEHLCERCDKMFIPSNATHDGRRIRRTVDGIVGQDGGNA